MAVNIPQLLNTPSQASITQQQAVAARLQNRLLKQTWGSQVDMVNAESQLKQIEAQTAGLDLQHYQKTGTSPASMAGDQIKAQTMQARAALGQVQMRMMEFEHELLAKGTESDKRQYTMSREAMKDSYYQFLIAQEQGADGKQALEYAQKNMESFWPSLDKNWQTNFDPIAGEAIVRADTERTQAIKDWREQFTQPPGQGIRWKNDESTALRLYRDGKIDEAFSQTKVAGGVETTNTPQDAARLASIQSAKSSLQQAANLIYKADQSGALQLDRSAVLALNLPPLVANTLGKDTAVAGQSARTYLMDAIEARFRAETGAAARQDEVDRIWMRLGPSPLDRDDVIEVKFKVFDKWINSALTNVDPNIDPATYLDSTLRSIDSMYTDELQAKRAGQPKIVNITPIAE